MMEVPHVQPRLKEQYDLGRSALTEQQRVEEPLPPYLLACNKNTLSNKGG